MGFFGVAAADEGETLAIERCHINLWTLGGLFGYRVYCFDVGLLIRANSQPVKKLRIGLPLATAEAPQQALGSLRGAVGNPKVAALIFAREDVLDNGSLVIEDEKVPILDIDRPQCEIATGPRAKHFSLWTLRLSPELKPGGVGYLRVRFYVRTPGRLWLWQRSFLSKNRAVVDLRVNDVREAQSVTDIAGFTRCLLPLGKLDAFVIAPGSFSPAVTTPEANYIRGLEGSVWEGYLGRRTDIRGNEKFLVHHWDGDGDTVTKEAPFRGFIQLERRRSLLPSWSDLMPVILALLAAWALFRVDLRDPGWLSDVDDFLFSGFPELSGIYAIVGVILVLLVLKERVREISLALRGFGGRLDRWIYTRLPGHD